MSDLNNIGAADALTLFTEFQRQNPGRLDGAINSGPTGDDFVFGGRDNLTGETVFIRATSDADINYASFYNPYTENLRSGFFDGQLPYNPALVTLPPAVFTPLTYLDSGSVFGNSFGSGFNNSFGSGFTLGTTSFSSGNNYGFTSGLNLSSGFTLGVAGSTGGLFGFSSGLGGIVLGKNENLKLV